MQYFCVKKASLCKGHVSYVALTVQFMSHLELCTSALNSLAWCKLYFLHKLELNVFVRNQGNVCYFLSCAFRSQIQYHIWEFSTEKCCVLTVDLNLIWDASKPFEKFLFQTILNTKVNSHVECDKKGSWQEPSHGDSSLLLSSQDASLTTSLSYHSLETQQVQKAPVTRLNSDKQAASYPLPSMPS